jgi:topoisomerase-4 subunit A
MFAFTACETSVAPLGCVIEDNKPLFIGVSDMLKISTNRTVLLKANLKFISELEEQWHFVFGANIYRNKIYRDIEENREKMLYKQLMMV